MTKLPKRNSPAASPRRYGATADATTQPNCVITAPPATVGTERPAKATRPPASIRAAASRATNGAHCAPTPASTDASFSATKIAVAVHSTAAGATGLASAVAARAAAGCAGCPSQGARSAADKASTTTVRVSATAGDRGSKPITRWMSGSVEKPAIPYTNANLNASAAPAAATGSTAGRAN